MTTTDFMAEELSLLFPKKQKTGPLLLEASRVLLPLTRSELVVQTELNDPGLIAADEAGDPAEVGVAALLVG